MSEAPLRLLLVEDSEEDALSLLHVLYSRGRDVVSR
jgi:hypothetical protein